MFFNVAVYVSDLDTSNKTRNSSGDEIPERDIGSHTPLALTVPCGGGFLWDDIRKILHGGQRMAKVQNSEEILPKVSTP